MNDRIIEIKAWFGDWNKVELPQAKKFIKGMWDFACNMKEYKKAQWLFDKHVKGLTVEEIEKLAKEK